jgi:hypothetical protein
MFTMRQFLLSEVVRPGTEECDGTPSSTPVAESDSTALLTMNSNVTCCKKKLVHDGPGEIDAALSQILRCR